MTRLVRDASTAGRFDFAPAGPTDGLQAVSAADAGVRQSAGDFPGLLLPADSNEVGPTPAEVAELRSLQTNLSLIDHEAAMKSVVFVGAAPGCGVSTVAQRFAGALASDGDSRVLLIEVTLDPLWCAAGSRNGCHELDALERRFCPDARSTSSAGPGVFRARLAAPGTSVLRTPRFDDFLRIARECFDHIVVDAPPLQRHTETLVLCRKGDAVVLVVRADRTRRKTALWASQQIRNADGNLVGVVLNRRRFHVPRWLYERF